jgi:hypothetical protein
MSNETISDCIAPPPLIDHFGHWIVYFWAFLINVKESNSSSQRDDAVKRKNKGTSQEDSIPKKMRKDTVSDSEYSSCESESDVSSIVYVQSSLVLHIMWITQEAWVSRQEIMQ